MEKHCIKEYPGFPEYKLIDMYPDLHTSDHEWSIIFTRCVKTAGDGRRIIQMDMKNRLRREVVR